MKPRKHSDLPEDLPPPDDDIWETLGIEFDDYQDIERADIIDKQRLERIYAEEDEGTTMAPPPRKDRKRRKQTNNNKDGNKKP